MPQSYEELRKFAEASAKPRNPFALASLIFGALSFLGGITALPGILCGIVGLNRAKNAGTSQSLAAAGVILSLIGIPVGLATGPKLLQMFSRGIGHPIAVPGDDSEARAQSADNLRRIGIALRDFDAAKGSFPLGANCDEDDKPLLSWRVSILPQLGHQELYEQFNLDEPWDSPANKALIAQMPEVYANPKKPNDRERGETLYKVFVGEKAVFSHTPRPGDAKPENENLSGWGVNDLIQAPRGQPNVLLAIEAGDPVIWTKPADLPYADGQPLPNLKSPYSEYVLVLMGQERVLNVRYKNADFEAALRASIDPASTSPLTLDR